MDKKNDFRKKFQITENTPDQAEDAFENALTANTPESYYHNINDVSEAKEDRYYEIFDEKKPKSRIWSVIAIAVAIVSVICSFFGWAGILIGALAVIFAAVSRLNLGYFDGMAIGGIIIGIFGAVFGCSVEIVSVLLSSEVLAVVLPSYVIR